MANTQWYKRFTDLSEYVILYRNNRDESQQQERIATTGQNLWVKIIVFYSLRS